MGKINGCLKCLFIFFNILFAIIGCVMIYGAVKISFYSQQVAAVGGPSLSWIWVFALGILGISCLGIFAGFSEKEMALKVFAGFMGAGMVIMLIFGIIIAVANKRVKDGFHDAASELVKNYMKDENTRDMLSQTQQSMECCGVVSASDWGNDIPDSCVCQPGHVNTGFSVFGASGCKNKPQGTSGPDLIYAKSCGDYIIAVFDLLFKFLMGFFFFFAVTAFLGLLVSLLMVHLIRRHDSSRGGSIAMKGY